MKNFTLYIIVFFVLFFGVFIGKKGGKEYQPLPTGVLYSVHDRSKTILSEQTEKTIYKDSSSSNIPIISVFCETKPELPRKFLAKITTKDEADYVIINKKQPAGENQKEPGNKQTKKEISVNKKRNPYTIVKKDREKPLSFYTLTNIVKNSDKTYFFSNNRKELQGVTVGLYSITPWGKKNILKFQIINAQPEYFFIANISLYDEKMNLLQADYFNESLVSRNKTILGFVLLSNQKQKKYSFNLLESGGKKRAFEINFTAP